MRIQAGENLNSLENFLKEYITKNEAKMQSHDATLRSLETQIGQLVNALTNHPQGTLPSNTENPRREGKEHCKAILLRSGKALEQPQEKNELDGEPSSIQKEERQDGHMNPVQSQDEQHEVAGTCQNRPPLPFPQRFQKKQQDKQFGNFLNVLKQLHINILLVEALEQMPNYVIEGPRV
ncbi:uncharacterized protein LOC112093777 [Morus notabilis]|uniref:uncharacterized protein LOC112093777 n=1 Tax=Morus notabilis TaxID=981085 RepID=UPI000CED2A4E|nr:uncharacterized protein LOC112093777 [Morus notabilis]